MDFQLTIPQMNIWNLQKFYPDSSISNVCGVIYYNGSKDLDKYVVALNDVIKRQSGLRLRFHDTSDGPVQYVAEYCWEEIPIVSFSSRDELEVYAYQAANTAMPMIDSKMYQFTIATINGQTAIIALLSHLISDAWTLGLLARQVQESYSTILDMDSETYYDYVDCVHSFEKYLKSTRYANDEKYWLEKYSQCPEPSPIKLITSSTTSIEAKRISRQLPLEMSIAVQHFCEETGITPAVVFESCIYVYLARVNPETKELTIGMPTLNRHSISEKNTAGMFISTLPLTIEVNREKSALALMKDITSAHREVFRHQRYPYSRIVKNIREKHNFSGSLYDVLVSYQNAETGVDAETVWIPNGYSETQFALHIDNRDNGSSYTWTIDYQTEVFHQETEVQLVIDRLEYILRQIILKSDIPVAKISILPDAEYQQVVLDFNGTSVEYPRDKCVHQLFENQVKKTPDKTAMIACDRTLTYRELNEEANRIAHGLMERGVGVGDIVAFALPRNSHLIPAMFGILKAGAVYLPIDPDYPQDRINYMLRDSRAKLFVTGEFIGVLLENDNIKDPELSLSSESLCYCIYTSGSTGKPKGTLLKHRGIVNLATNLNIYRDLSVCERFGLLTTITFDVATQEIMTALLNGFIGVLFPERKETGVEEIIEQIETQRIDIIFATPTYFNALTKNEQNAVALLKTLKVVALAGERFSLNDTVREIKDSFDVVFENQYGPVELHVIATATTVYDNDFDSIGRPIGNNQAYILDKNLVPAPIGVTGELCIAGDGVGVGYLNRPELTAEKFIDNPFGVGKLYKTGDLAYWRDDGNIIYVGRNDFQVKIRGLRIELGEIENAIAGVEGVSQAVAVVRKDDTGRQLLFAFYTESMPVAVEEIRTALREKLPRYMIPHSFTKLDTFPLTSSGKVNRKGLPEVKLSDITSNVEYAAPQTPTEERLSDIWKELLKIGQVGREDEFFALGGDSLTAIALLSRLENIFDISISVKDIFEQPILKKFAEFIDNARVYRKKIAATGAQRYALLPQQMAIYAACSKEPQALTYNMPAKFVWEDGIDKDRLKTCLRRLMELHPELKASIHSDNGIVYASYEKDVEIAFEEYDEENAKGFVRPFILDKAPLVRIGFTKSEILFDIHHIIADGESVNIILRDLAVLYAGAELKKPEFSYADYAAYFRAADFSEHKAYFKNMLKCDFEPLELPQRKDGLGIGGSSLEFHLPIEMVDRGRKFGRVNGLTDTMLFLGVYGVMLSKYTGHKDVLTSVVLSNRTHSETDNVVGMFANTLPVYLQVNGDVKAYFDNIRDLVLNLYQYQELPFSEIADTVGMSDKTVINSAFVYQADGEKSLRIGGKIFVPERIDTRSPKFDLLFEVTPASDNYAIRVEYKCEKFEDNLIQKLFAAYEKVFAQLTLEKISDISILSNDEYKKVVNDFNDTTVVYSRNKCVYELFEQQAKRTPDTIALIYENKCYTYRQIDELSNGMAISLLKLGVCQGDMVAALLNRNEMVILTQLAVLKIGAVFVPIDSRYPEERIRYIISESGAKIILKNRDNELADAQVCDIEDLEIIPTPGLKHPYIDSKDACYIIFTSGSTGKPKGCVLTNRGIANFCRNNNILEACNKLGRQVCISVNTISFDYFIAESLLPLANGYTVVLASEDESINQDRFKRLVETTQANIIQTTPTRYKLYFGGKQDLTFLSQFDVIVSSGEALPLELLQTFHKNSKAQIFNPLGPSECSVWVAGGELHLTDNEPSSEDITIGKPIANNQIYILDQDLNPLPIGVTGELCIAGDGVGAGYLNHPELTAAKFIDNPFGAGKLYKTGDLAYWREDGSIIYIGRNDLQVKIRGLRIELGEIESIMAGFDGIGMTAVADKQDSGGRQYLVGYYTSKRSIDEKTLRQYISAKLPQYMVPNHFVHLAELPMTPSGKTDRKNLPLPKFGFQAAEYVQPRTEQEKVLCNILAKLFQVESVGVTDDFFELGGDSLRAIEYSVKAHSAGVNFALQSVFDFPTVETLCRSLQEKFPKEAVFSAGEFQKYEPILRKNIWGATFTPIRSDIKSVLLTGGTGFLGAHILDALMKHGVEKIYCLVRVSGEKLLQILKYYFNERYTIDFGTKIIPVVGDLEDERISDNLPMQVNYVIHAAASVKHYGSWQQFKRINVNGTKHVIAYTQRVGAKMIHISTTSVSGNAGADQMELYVSKEEKYFYESSLYINQPLNNVYVRSKFEAEMLVLDAMLNGMEANIIRVGNLTNRKSDFKFQPNYRENAFLTRAKAMLQLRCIPGYLMPLYAEFSPVDSTADAIVNIAEYMNDQYTVFHVNSHQNLYFDRMLEYLKRLGYPFEIVDGEQFVKRIQDSINSQRSYIYEALLNDLDDEGHLQYDTRIHIENDFTVRYLKTIGFEWPEIDYAYVKGYLDYFKQLGYLGK